MPQSRSEDLKREESGGGRKENVDLKREISDEVLQNCKITCVSESVKGARDGNEDYHDSIVVNNAFVVSVMCDGHGGVQISQTLGLKFQNTLKELLEKRGNDDLSPEDMVQLLRCAYNEAVKEVDDTPLPKYQHNQGHPLKPRIRPLDSTSYPTGSTISAVLFSIQSKICATLQLGDCEIMVDCVKAGRVFRLQALD